MVGIYKIASPSGKVYIGQSFDVETRWKNYSTTNCHKGRLLNSLKKYGFDKHTAEVVHALPKDVSQEVMNNYEQFYLDLYRQSGFIVMNLREAGSRGKHSQESKIKMSLAGKGKVITEEAKKKMSLAKIGKKQKPEAVEKSAASRRGLKIPPEIVAKQSAARIGAKRTDEMRLKMSLAQKGKPWSSKRREAQNLINARLSQK